MRGLERHSRRDLCQLRPPGELVQRGRSMPAQKSFDKLRGDLRIVAFGVEIRPVIRVQQLVQVLRRIETAVDREATDHTAESQIEQRGRQQRARAGMADALADVGRGERSLVEGVAHCGLDAAELGLTDVTAPEVRREVLLVGRQMCAEREGHLVSRDHDRGPCVPAGHVDQRHAVDRRAIDPVARGSRHARPQAQIHPGRPVGRKPADLSHAGLDGPRSRVWHQALPTHPPGADARETGRHRGRRTRRTPLHQDDILLSRDRCRDIGEKSRPVRPEERYTPS